MSIYSIRSGSCLISTDISPLSGGDVGASGNCLRIGFYSVTNQIWDPLFPDRLTTVSFPGWKIEPTATNDFVIATNTASSECVVWHIGYSCGVRCDLALNALRHRKIWLYGAAFIADSTPSLLFIPVPPEAYVAGRPASVAPSALPFVRARSVRSPRQALVALTPSACTLIPPLFLSLLRLWHINST